MNNHHDTYEAALLAALAALEALTERARTRSEACSYGTAGDNYDAVADTATTAHYGGTMDAWHVVNRMVNAYRRERNGKAGAA